MRDVRTLLGHLTALLPPPSGRHGLVLIDGQLVLCLRVGMDQQLVWLDDDDLVKAPADLAAEVASHFGLTST